MGYSQMFNFTPPIRRKCRISALLLFTCTLLISCTSCSKKSSTESAPRPVEIRKSLIYNGDSLAYYAERAYLHDDPDALFITGLASFISVQDPDFPDSIYTVPIDEAEIMLLHAADLGQPDALQFIQCLDKQGHWHHSIPEIK